MAKKRARIISSIALLSVAPIALMGASYGPSDAHKQNETVKGNVKMDIKMTSAEATYMKNKMEQLAQQDDTSKHRSESVTKSHHQNIEALFHTSHDGKTIDLIEPFPSVTVQVGSQTVKADSHGNFDLGKVTPGQYSVTISQDKHVFDRSKIKIDGNPGKPIGLTISNSLQGLYQNMMKQMDMSKPMSSSQMSSSNTMSPMVSMNPLSTCSPPLGPYVPGEIVGKGQGKMKVIDPATHVSCNKSSGDCGGDFPFNNSDCAQSIAAGFAYDMDPWFLSDYADGIFCVQEGMAWAVNLDGSEESNIYCNEHPNNGQKPSNDWYHGYQNQGYNCSSFPFLNHDERLNWNSGS